MTNRRLLLALALLAGCTPAPAPGAPTPSASAMPSAAPTAAPASGITAYSGGSLEIDGAAVPVPTKLQTTKVVNGGAVSRVFSVGLPAEATEGSWFAIVTYSTQDAARTVSVQLNQKTGPRPQDLNFHTFSRLDMGTGDRVMLVPTDATGSATEHDGVVDIAFAGKLPAVPGPDHVVKASFPGLPLN